MLSAVRFVALAVGISAALSVSAPLHARGGGGGGGHGIGGGVGHGISGGGSGAHGGGHGGFHGARGDAYRGAYLNSGYGVDPNEYGPENNFARGDDDYNEDFDIGGDAGYTSKVRRTHRKGCHCKCWTVLPDPCTCHKYWPYYTRAQLHLIAFQPRYYSQHVRGIRYH